MAVKSNNYNNSENSSFTVRSRFNKAVNHSSGLGLLSLSNKQLLLNMLKNICNQLQQEAQLMLTTGSTRLAVSRGQQTWYHSTCYI